MRVCLLLCLWPLGQCWGAWQGRARGGGGSHNPGEAFPVIGGGNQGSQGSDLGEGSYNLGGEDRGGHQGGGGYNYGEGTLN